MLGPPGDNDEEQRQTLWVGGLSPNVTEDILYELFQNAGPLMSVRQPVDKDTKRAKNFAFVRYQHEESVPYAVEIFKDAKLFGQNLKMQNRTTGAGMPQNQSRGPQQNFQPQANNYQNQNPPANNFARQNSAPAIFNPQLLQGFPVENQFPRGGIHARIGFPPPDSNVQGLPRFDLQQQEHRDHQMRHGRDDHSREHQMRHGRDERPHHRDDRYQHHRNHSDPRSRGFSRDNNQESRDRSYDNRRRR